MTRIFRRLNDQQLSLARVIMASFAGSTIEWYDFGLFSASSALVFNRIFFANLSPLIGLLLSLLTFAIGYIARPVGGIVFGHFGDRIGRKPVLIVSFMMMGIATVLIGCLPGYGTIGVFAPIALIMLRVVQGIGVGGEYGGAALLVTESCPPNRRGLFSSAAMIGNAAGGILGTGVFSLFAMLPREQFLEWGWRVPYLLSVILLFIGLWLRMQVDETSAFKQIARVNRVLRLPLAQVLRFDLKRVLLVCGARSGETMQYTVISVFSLSYATKFLGVHPSLYLSALSFSGLVQIFVMPFAGAMSDRFGRRSIGILAGVATVLCGSAFIPLMTAGSNVLVVIAVVSMIGVSAGIGNSLPSAYFPELFDVRVRYTAISVGYQLGTVFGGLTPAFCTVLFMYLGINAILAYLAGSGLLVLICYLLLPETLDTRNPASSSIPIANMGDE
ncbi:MFS transporter [Caballeronia sordidicola]|nr:MFS transporter [Caballeronia sordidicola]